MHTAQRHLLPAPAADCIPLCLHQQRLAARRNQPIRAALQAASADRQAAKEKLLSKVGNKNGLDRTPEQQKVIKHDIAELASTSGDSKLDLAGSHWTLRFSDSTSSSAGKLGPFIGYVEQEFPASRPGKYYNKVAVGPIRAKLTADYEYASDSKILVSFTDIEFMLGPLKYKPKDFTGKGHWILRYSDPSLRVLDTNADHVFVLERLATPKLNF